MNSERFLTQEDASLLSRLAEQMLRVREVRMNFAEKLVELISTSILLPGNAAQTDHAALGSIVTYRIIGTTDHRWVHIVCPRDANDALAQVSILSPVAMAVLGRRIGSIVDVALPFCQVQYIEIVDVAREGAPGRLPSPGCAAAAVPAAERRYS